LKKSSSHHIKNKNNSHSWKLIYEHFNPAREGLREALCTLGNGYFATRGAAPESSASRIHYPGTYIAGVYNKLGTDIAGRTIFNEDLVNCPNWLSLTFKIGKGDWIVPSRCHLLSYYQELDIRRSLLSRKICLRDPHGYKTTIESQRIIHRGNPHLAALRYVITPENYEGKIVIRSSLDGKIQNTGVARYRQLNSKHLKSYSLGSFNNNGIYLSMKTSQSAINISEAAKTNIFSEGKRLKFKSRILKNGKEKISQEFEIPVRKGKRYEIEKIVSIYTSRDKDVRSPVKAAVRSVRNSFGFNMLFKTNVLIWESLWKKFDIQIKGDGFSQRVIRLHIFHLLQTVSIHNTMIDTGFPVRGLHGEAYRGHIFWDNLFVLPFFNLHTPKITKALLLYRYRRLSQARKYARKHGYRGAMFPWQSGSTGEEETQLIHLNPISGRWGPDYSRIQRHVSFAIAHNVWLYWKDSGDLNFLSHYGAETIFSIARFGASLSKYNPKDRRYHTEGIMGPDEFHEKFPWANKPGFKDNAYTNLLIVWTLLVAHQLLTILPEHNKTQIFKKLGLTQKELNRWQDITRKMNIIINKDGIISQFDGYFGLKELNWKDYRAKYGKIKRIDRILKAEGKSPNEYKVAKQADVLMIFYLLSLAEIKNLLILLGYKFDRDLLKKNYNYYIKRTSHGSSLSKVVYCYLANLLGKPKESWDWFLRVLRSDLYDTQGGTTPEGVHTGVMGGSLDIVFRSFAGISLLDDRIKINPNLPRAWSSLNFKFCYREKWISLYIKKRHIKILIYDSKAKKTKIPFEIYGKLHRLSLGRTHSFSKRGARINKGGGNNGT